MSRYKILYDTSLTYPGFQANKIQTMLMADGLSHSCDTTLLVNKLKKNKIKILSNYGIKNTKLKIYDLWPLQYLKFYKKNHGKLSPLLKILPKWNDKNKKNVLYVRRPNELISWGNARQKKGSDNTTQRDLTYPHRYRNFSSYFCSAINSSRNSNKQSVVGNSGHLAVNRYRFTCCCSCRSCKI